MDKRPDLRNYRSGSPGTPITVNVDEWMQKAHGPRAAPRPAEQEYPKQPKSKDIDKAKQALREYKEKFEGRNERIARQAKLTENPQECSVCGHTEHFYKDDYMCYVCRDVLDAS